MVLKLEMSLGVNAILVISFLTPSCLAFFTIKPKNKFFF